MGWYAAGVLTPSQAPRYGSCYSLQVPTGDNALSDSERLQGVTFGAKAHKFANNLAARTTFSWTNDARVAFSARWSEATTHNACAHGAIAMAFARCLGGRDSCGTISMRLRHDIDTLFAWSAPEHKSS